MNQSLVGVVATLATLASIGMLSKPPEPTPAREVVVPVDQVEAIQRMVQSMAPGARVQVEVVHRDGGVASFREEGTGRGASAEAVGDKLSDKITGDAPVVSRGADGSVSARGGDVERSTSASALRLPPMPWQNPLFWIGIAALGACGFGVYAGLRRLALVSGVAGVGLLAAAFYPGLLLVAIGIVVVVIFGPYVYAEVRKRQAERNHSSAYEALRAVVAGVEHRDVPAEARGAVKAAIAKEADGMDKRTIDAVKRADGIGKYAE